MSCAKFPATGSTTSTKRVIFTMTTAAPINPNYVYIVAIHASEDVTSQKVRALRVVEVHPCAWLEVEHIELQAQHHCAFTGDQHATAPLAIVQPIGSEERTWTSPSC